MPRPDPRICSASRANFPGSALLHFLFVEQRCLLLYWWSFRSALIKMEVTLYLMSEHVVTKDVGALWLDIVGCVADEVAVAANSFDTSFQGSCVSYAGDNYLPWMLHSCSLIALLILLWSLVRFMAEGNSIQQVFGSGNYLVFSWKLGHDRIYRTLATILPFYTGALLGAILAVSLGLVGSSGGSFGLRRALSLLGADLSLQVLSLVALLRPTMPGFHWQTKEFRRLHFARTWLNLIWESNDMLAQTLSDAICIRTPDFIHVQDYALLWELHVKYDQPSEEEQEEDFRSLVAHENEKPSEDGLNKSLVPCGGWCLASVAVAAIASLIALLFVASGAAIPSHHQDELVMETPTPAPCVPVHAEPVPCVPVHADCPPPISCPRDPGADYCMADFDHWQTLWDDERKGYCCNRCGRACPEAIVAVVPAPPPPPPPPPPLPAPPTEAPVFVAEFNCNAGFRNWYFGWSDSKKHWCCQHFDMGCPGTWNGPDHPEATGRDRDFDSDYDE